MTLKVSYDAQAFPDSALGRYLWLFTELVRTNRSKPSLGVKPLLRSRVAASCSVACRI